MGADTVAAGPARRLGGADEDMLMWLRLWWSQQRQHRDQQRRELLQRRVVLELRRVQYFEHEVPVYASAESLAQRLGVTASQLQPLLDQLAEQRLVFPGLTPGTCGVREWKPDS
jgi:hypothetical protein